MTTIGTEWHVKLPFDEVTLQWELGSLYAVNKHKPAERRKLNLDTMTSEGNGTRTVKLSWNSTHHEALVTVDKDASMAKMDVVESLLKNKRDKAGALARAIFVKAPVTSTELVKNTTIEYPNPVRILPWEANKTALQWEKGGRLFAVKKEGKGKIALPFDKAPVQDGQFIFDIKSSDNKLLRVQASVNYDSAKLLQFNSLDFPVKNGLAVVDENKAILQETTANPVIEQLKNLDWVAGRGYLQWQPGNRLFLVEDSTMPRSQGQRVEIDLDAIRPAGDAITLNITAGSSPVVLEVSGDLKNASLRRLSPPPAWEWKGKIENWSDSAGYLTVYRNNHPAVVSKQNRQEADATGEQMAAFPARSSALTAADASVPKLFECHRPAALLQTTSSRAPS